VSRAYDCNVCFAERYIISGATILFLFQVIILLHKNNKEYRWAVCMKEYDVINGRDKGKRD